MNKDVCNVLTMVIVLSFIFFANSAAAKVFKFDSFDKIPYKTMPQLFEAEVEGEHLLLAVGEESVPTGINQVDAQETALEEAELKARGKIVEFVNDGELEKTDFIKSSYSSTEGKDNSTSLKKSKDKQISQTVKTKMIRGISLLYTEKNKSSVSVVVGISKSTLESADTFREMLKENHARP